MACTTTVSNMTTSKNDLPDAQMTGVTSAVYYSRQKRLQLQCVGLVTVLTICVLAIALAALAVTLSSIQLANHTSQIQQQEVLMFKLNRKLQEILNEVFKHEPSSVPGQAMMSDTAKTVTSTTDSETTATLKFEPTTIITPIIFSSQMCGGSGWRRAAFINMTDLNQDCPQGLSLTDYSIRSCGRGHSGYYGCSSVIFPFDGPQYSQVCGRAIAYRWGKNYGFYGYHSEDQTIDGCYVDGLSLTHGSPRTHIWTFASGLFNGTKASNREYPILRCPCDPGNSYKAPPFVENNHFCESTVVTVDTWIGQDRFFPDNALWDGQDLLSPCYGLNNPPWFNKTLSEPTTDDIELRMCFTGDLSVSNIGIQLLELYIK